MDAAFPSDVVVLVADTVTGAAEHDVIEDPTLGRDFIVPSAALHAPLESPAVVVLAEVYSAATRAALSVQINAFA